MYLSSCALGGSRIGRRGQADSGSRAARSAVQQQQPEDASKALRADTAQDVPDANIGGQLPHTSQCHESS
eukprot:4230421-Amphidinium_carterae.2